MAAALTHYWQFIRPFTLLVPAGGMIAGSMIALGAEPKWQWEWSSSTGELVLKIVAGAVMAAALNGFSNGINQVFDIEVDRVNKPHRLLPSRKMTLQEAWTVSLFCLMIALGLAAWINWQCFSIACIAALLTYIYSAPPLRTKCRGFIANVTVAIPRGTLLIIAGWTTVKSALRPEPWYIGLIFGLFFLGAVTTKDFSDVEGDKATNCRTLPIIYGTRRAIQIIGPFLVLPFLAIIPLAISGLLEGNTLLLSLLGILLASWGGYICYLLLDNPPLTGSPGSQMAIENHPSWKHMYLLTALAQLGFAAAYLIR